MQLFQNLRIGPAGWRRQHWDGLVYPLRRERGFHPLRYLARYVDLVELDGDEPQTFRAELVRVWEKALEGYENFRFTVKLPRRFTHERCLDTAAVKAARQSLGALRRAGRLGCVLMQFPWAFRFNAETRSFFIELRRAFHDFPLSAELRHSSWTLDEAVGTLIDYKVGCVNLDQPAHVRATPPTALLTTGVGYFRLHGRSRPNWFEDFHPQAPQLEADYLYTRAELEEWVPRIRRVAGLAEETYVVFTCDAAAKAMVNALQMQDLLGCGGKLAPPDLMARYHEELPGFGSAAPFQPVLFGHRAA